MAAANSGRDRLVPFVGFVEVEPRNGRHRNERVVRLVHRLTLERLELDAAFCEKHSIVLREGTRFSLAMASGALHLAVDEAIVAEASQFFSEHPRSDKDGKWFRDSGGESTAMSRSAWAQVMKYLVMNVCDSPLRLKVWQVRSYALGAQHWVSLPDLWAFQPMFESEFPSRGQAGTLRHLGASAASLHLSCDLVLKRAVRAPGQDETNRFLDDHTISATGVLLLLAVQGYAKHQSKKEMRARSECYRDLFMRLTDKVFGDEVIELVFDPDMEGWSFDVCCRPTETSSISVVVENSMVSFADGADSEFVNWCKDIAEVSPEVDNMHVSEFLGLLCKSKRCWPQVARSS